MSIYTDNGYESSIDYLNLLSEEYGVSLTTVYALYNVLGDSEAFDGLVTAVQDAAEGGFE